MRDALIPCEYREYRVHNDAGDRLLVAALFHLPYDQWEPAVPAIRVTFPDDAPLHRTDGLERGFRLIREALFVKWSQSSAD